MFRAESDRFFPDDRFIPRAIQWLDEFIARAKDSRSLIRGYTELEGVIEGFARSQLLPFSTASAEVYDDLRKQRVRVGAMDLRIAAIVIANQMTLLTCNTVDFERVPNLAFEDWTIPKDD
jgi:tRNA(fMet)-specific endonuclease VapC